MRLQVGVIGLGRRWLRYRSLLARLHQHVEVRAVCDQVSQRAETVARKWRCAAASGPIELLERDDVEAVLLLDEQWYGLWPLLHTCIVKKPILCAVSLAQDDGNADALHQQIESSGLPTLMTLEPLLMPAMRCVRELLTHRLGRARFVRVHLCAAAAQGDSSPDLLNHPSVLSLLAGCAWLLDDAPRSVWTIEQEGTSFVTLLMRFGGERLAQVTLWTATPGRTPPRFELAAEAGSATAELPNRLHWRDAEGQHSRRLPPRTPEQTALEQFLVSLHAGKPLTPSFTDAYQALTWLRAALRSRSERKQIDFPKPGLTPASHRMPT